MTTGRHWFISDTHFCEDRPEHLDTFELICQQPKPGDSLLLLGDIFEIWVTDDLAVESDHRVERTIKRCVERGVIVYFMHGNRDFMVGKLFAQRTGASVISDPTVWTLPFNRQCVLTHGDWFCTDDKHYRRYRRIIRNPIFQFCFRHLPKSTRLRIAHNIRKSSTEAHKKQGNRSYDANQTLIQRYYDQYAPIDTIIMGHTHLPDLHERNGTIRLVLGDWRDTAWFAVADKESGFKLFESDLMLSNIECRFHFQ